MGAWLLICFAFMTNKPSLNFVADAPLYLCIMARKRRAVSMMDAPILIQLDNIFDCWRKADAQKCLL